MLYIPRSLHVCCVGHVFFHLRELLDVLDRSMQSTVDRLEAPDSALFIPRQRYSVESVGKASPKLVREW